MQKSAVASTALSFLLIAGCSSGPAPAAKKKKEEKAEPVAALKAFFAMYRHAVTWGGPGIQAHKLESINLTDVPAKDGKYGAWRCLFVSPTKGTAKSYTYAVKDAQGLYKDVFAGHEERFNATGTSSPYNVQAIKKDSDAAYETAVKKSADYIRKNPGMPVMVQVEKVRQFSNPVYRIIWGTSVSTSNYSIYVDASSGEYLSTMH
jgi:hypothetical protein